MTTDRVRLEDDDQPIAEELDKVDWGKLLQYGRIEVTVANGEWMTVTQHPTTQNRKHRRRPG